MTPESLPALPEPFLEMYREVTPHVYNAWAEQARAIQRTAYEAGRNSDVVRQMAEALALVRMSRGWQYMAFETQAIIAAALRAYREQAK